MDSFYSQNELLELGFKKIGTNVLISKKSSIYNAQNIEIGDNVRIDDFCLLSGTIKLGNYIHIGAYSALYLVDILKNIQEKMIETIIQTLAAITNNLST